MLNSSLCDYSDAYILVKGTIIVNNTATVDANEMCSKVHNRSEQHASR